MMKTTSAFTDIDLIVARYKRLEHEYGLPRAGAIFECFQATRQPNGSIPLGAEQYIQTKLGRPLAEQRRLRSQHDLLSQGMDRGARGVPAERLYQELLGNEREALTVRVEGPLLSGVGTYSHLIGNYLAQGGYQAAAAALMNMQPTEIIEEIKRSNLKGRGGAYFPVGVKWEAATKMKVDHKFLICNADEGEPPTRKDKVLMDLNPHLLLEGMLIAGFAIGARLGVIYVGGDYEHSIRRLTQAADEARANGWLGKNIQGSGVDFEVHIFAGSGSYVAGCDTAMLESLEGKAAIPRATPPFPTEAGLAGKPTVVNNVETLCNIPVIIKLGGQAFSKIGNPDCPGTKIFGLCGDIAKPGMYELPTGTDLQTLIEAAGGVVEAGEYGLQPSRLAAVSPGGVTTGLLSAEEAAEVSMDPGSLAAKGTFLGSGAISVFNAQRDLRAYVEDVMAFLSEESCGSCMICPISIGMTQRTLARTHSAEASAEEISAISERDVFLPQILKCGLGKSSHTTVRQAVSKFPTQFAVELPVALFEEQR